MAFGIKGKQGGGQVIATQYSIPSSALNFWKERLSNFNIAFKSETRFKQRRLSFQDHDGLNIELVEEDESPVNEWTFNGIDQSNAIKGFYGAYLNSTRPEKTLQDLQNVLGYRLIDESETAYLLESSDSLGRFIELDKASQPLGEMGVGIVHHIAFRVHNEEIQLKIRELIDAKGYHITPVINRSYFKSIYFRESGSILFELATDQPGFTLDEPLEQLGMQLKIPAQHNHLKDKILSHLKPITIREVNLNETNH